MTDQPDKILNVSIVADRAAAQATAQVLAQNVADVRDLTDAYNALREAGSDIGTAAVESLNAATSAADENDKAIQQLRDDYIAAADAAKQLPQDDGGGGLDFGALRQARTLGRASGMILGNNPVSSDLRKIGSIGVIGDLLQPQFDKANAAIGTLLPELEGVTVGFAGVEVAVSPLVLILAPLVIAIGAVALAMKVLSDQAKSTADDEKKAYDEEKAIIAQKEADRKKAETTSSAQNAKDIADTVLNRQDAQDELDKQLAARAKTKADYDALGTRETQIGQQFGGAAQTAATIADVPERNRLRALGEQQDKDIKDAQDSLDKLNKAYIDQTGQLQKDIDAVEAGKKALQDKTDAEKNAQDAITTSTQREEQYSKLRETGSAKAIESMVQQNDTDIKYKEEEVSRLKSLLDQQEKNTPAYDNAQKAYDSAKKSLDDLTQSNKELKDSVLPVVEARQREIDAEKEAATSSKEYVNALKQLENENNTISTMEKDRAKQIAKEAEDDKRNAERSAVEKDFQTRIDEAKRDEAEQQVRDQAAQTAEANLLKFNDSKDKIDRTFYDATLKSYDSYIHDEQNLREKANEQRLQTLRSAQTDLSKLAGEGDVAGFIDRQNKAKQDLDNQAKQADDQEKARQQQYEKETQAAQEAHTQQLADLNKSFAEQKAAQEKADAQKIQQIENSGKQANTESGRLEQELNTIREQWRKDDLERQRQAEEDSYNQRLAVQIQKQQEMLVSAQQFLNQWNDAIKQAGQAGGEAGGVSSRQAIPQYAEGLPYVPYDRYLAYLDQGERVLTAREAAAYGTGTGAGPGGETYNVTVQNTVGDVATKSMLDEYQSTTVEGVKEGIRRAKGRGKS